ncbi:hypothetical protein BJ742DRAFT_393877 [Cladochytrium replicatum]|nr:hypothetical protein BJ742DRAFT_393877 [Cladochytrium replicatum]
MDQILDLVRQRLDWRAEHDDAAKMSRLPFWKLSLYRLPAIAMTLTFEIVVGVVISLFTRTMEKHLLLASFMPVLSAISGNIGLQASAATLRALATGHASENQLMAMIRVVVKELASATIIALVAGAVLWLVSGIWSASMAFGLVTGLR